jgi:hypothetical protein
MGHTGLKRRLVIPSCVVSTIRQKWPDINGEYRGFVAATGRQAAIFVWTVDNGMQLLCGATVPKHSYDDAGS